MSDGSISYRFLGLIGEGGFGKVYRARQETTDGFHKDVAIKLLTDEDPPKSLLKRFRDEARILGLIRDRAIVRVEPPILLSGRWAVVMEFVDGVSCGALIHTHGRVPPGVAVEIVGEVARALDNAYHMVGPEGQPFELLHRDIKPDNVQVTPSGDIRLLDFGIAKANFAQREVKTRAGFGGTPGYIAPERIEGTEVPAGDVYSLGVLLHEVVVGERPQGTITVSFEDDAPIIDPEELSIPDDLAADPDAWRVLEFASWMRNFEHGQRPTARQVEEHCRTMREELSGTYLRDWAESGVPNRHELPDDALVGQVVEVVSTATPAPAPPSAHDLTMPLPVSPSQAPETGQNTFALGAILAGSTGLALGLTLAVGAVLAVVGAGWWVARMPQLATSPTEQPAPVVAPEPVPLPAPPPAPVAPVPVAPTPAPVAPAPAPAAPVGPRPQPAQPSPVPEPTVIRLSGTEPEPAPGAAPAPVPVAPVPAPGPAPPPPSTGVVVVVTIPAGAKVMRNNEVLHGIGGRYELPPGSHMLTLVSSSGEPHMQPVNITRGKEVSICYSFETNSACEAR